MTSGYGVNGGTSRCFHLYHDLEECVGLARHNVECIAVREDYFECLHHSKEVRYRLECAGRVHGPLGQRELPSPPLALPAALPFLLLFGIPLHPAISQRLVIIFPLSKASREQARVNPGQSRPFCSLVPDFPHIFSSLLYLLPYGSPSIACAPSRVDSCHLEGGQRRTHQEEVERLVTPAVTASVKLLVHVNKCQLFVHTSRSPRLNPFPVPSTKSSGIGDRFQNFVTV